MKRLITRLSAVALAALVLPGAVSAQKEKTKTAPQKQDTEMQQIIITRKGGKSDKLQIEVNGDKVTVNGKPAEEFKDGDVTVDLNRMRGMAPPTRLRVFRNGDQQMIYLNEDENHAMLGVVTDQADQGVLIREVTQESAAEKAGLKVGDIITKVDNTQIASPDDLTKAIRDHKPGDKVSITYLRDNKEQQASAELTKWKGMVNFNVMGNGDHFNIEMPQMDFQPHMQVMPRVPRVEGFGDLWEAYAGRPRLGLSVQDTEDGKGVKVIDVDEEGSAQKAGIKENDLITAINDKDVSSADQVAQLVKENRDKPSIMVRLIRDGKTQNVEVKIPRKLKTADL
ncbi:MAG TPA: PDZ domain-containing protein [Chitinophagaceae bacterium]|nr:PDZ domain-containing protein [Chitinophagaceae bacterium]